MTFNYQAEAEQTNSPHYHATRVPRHHFENAIELCILDLNRLDHIKKAVFYGRELPQQTLDLFTAEEKQDQMFEPASKAMTVPLVHSIIGIATEAGELLEIFDKPEFDRTNFIEEVGDVLWYIAIGLNAVGSTFEEAQRINIAKLRKRYPEKFTEYDANNRDLKAERDVLESVEPRMLQAHQRLKLARGDGLQRHKEGFGRDHMWSTFELMGANEENEWLRGWDEAERKSAIHLKDIRNQRGGTINPGPVGREHGPEIYNFKQTVIKDETEHLLSSVANAERLAKSIGQLNKSFEIDGHRLNFQQAQTYIALKQTGKLGELLDGYQLPL